MSANIVPAVRDLFSEPVGNFEVEAALEVLDVEREAA